MNYKRIMRRVAIVFVSVMVLLSFFSVALLDLYTPRVYVTVIRPGDIAPMAVTYGVVAPVDTLRVMSPATGRITAIMPQGSMVDGESVLFEITRDLEGIQFALEEAERDFIVNEIHIATVTIARDEARQRAAQLTDDAQLETRQALLDIYNNRLYLYHLERDSIISRIDELTTQAENPVVYMRLDIYPNRMITAIAPDMELGFTVEEGAPIMTTAIRNNRFEIRAEFSHIHEFIGISQQVDIVVGREKMTGQTTRVALEGGRRKVIIELESELLIGGELAHITVHGESEPQQSIIPNSALRTNAWGAHYILFMESAARRGYVQATHVDVVSRDHSNTAISGQWGTVLPDYVQIVIVNSDMPIHEGDRVRHSQRINLPGNES